MTYGTYWHVETVDVVRNKPNEEMARLLRLGWEPFGVTVSVDRPRIERYHLRKLATEDVLGNWRTWALERNA